MRKEAGSRAYLLIEFNASMIPVAMVSHLMIPPKRSDTDHFRIISLEIYK